MKKVCFALALLATAPAQARDFTSSVTESDHVPVLRPEFKTPDEPNQLNWTEYTLYIHPEDTIAAVQVWLRAQNAIITLKRKDLRDQLSKNDFWVTNPSARDGCCRKKFSREDTRSATAVAWGIKVDKHPLGYQRQSDAVMAEACKKIATDGDPRRGPLFMLVEWVLAADKRAQPDNVEPNEA